MDIGQLKRLMWLRLVIVTTLLLSAAYVEAGVPEAPPFDAVYAVIAATYLLTVAYALVLRRAPGSAQTQAVVQVVFDLVLITLLAYLVGRGGSGVGFPLLYPLSVLSGSVLLSRRQAIQLAAAATLLYGGLLALVRQQALPPGALADVAVMPLRQLAFGVFVIGLVCGAVAVTGAYFAERLRSTGRELEDAVDEVAALKEVNQLIVQSLQSGVMIVSAQGVVQHLNAFGAAMLGLAASAAVGQSVRRVLGGNVDAESLRARAQRREWSRFDLQFATPSGSLPLGVSVAPLVAPSQQHGGGGYLLVFQDLTEVRRLERQAVDNEKLAAIGEVAAQLAHEIRNPLGSISGSAQVLMADRCMSEEQARLLSIITKESRRLSDSLNQFLLQTRTPERPHVPIDLGPLIEEAVTLLQNSPEVGRAHEVRLERGQGAHMCLADADAITQVFWNLARNGLEAMPDGGALTISLATSAESVVLALRDEGRGLGADALRPGFQPAAARGGLGLAIVYQIVRQHRGEISVLPAAPRGTRVEVRLPRLRVEAAA